MTTASAFHKLLTNHFYCHYTDVQVLEEDLVGTVFCPHNLADVKIR